MSAEPQTQVEAGKITVQVVYNGVTESLTVQSHKTVKALLEQAMDVFHITNQRHLMALFREDGTEVTPETVSLTDAHIVTGTVLALRPSAVKGGRG
jgi:hypothetical protein